MVDDMRNKFDEQLDNLNNELIKMGKLCERAISGAIKITMEDDHEELKREVLETDSEIDKKERDIESICMKLLLRQQPVARDLRVISSALKMISDMERIGDQASDIVELAQYIKKSDVKYKTHLSDMANEVIKMVTKSIKSFVKKDIEMARNVIVYDDVVDNYFEEIKKELIRIISSGESDGEEFIDILMIAKYLERIGDHARNIKEAAEEMHDKNITFSETGKKEIDIISSAVDEILSMAVEAFKNEDIALARKVEPLEQVVDILKETIRNKHISRLQRGICSTETGFVLSDIITNYERIADHCSNIAICLIETEKNSFSTHEYVEELRNSHDAQYEALFDSYKRKYSI